MKKNDSKKSSIEIILLFVMGGAVIIGGWFIFSSFMEKEDQSVQNVSENQSAENNKIAPTIGSFAPNFTLEDTKGSKFSLSNLREKATLIVFWKTDCGFCKKELPDLKKFAEENTATLEVVAISMRESKQTVQEYIEDNQVNFKVLLDKNGKVAQDYWVTGTPSHFLINKEGKIVTVQPGYASKKDLNGLLDHPY